MLTDLFGNLLEETDGTDRMISACLDYVRKAESIIIFGAGIGGAALFRLLQEQKLSSRVRGFCDNNSLKHGILFCGRQVLSPDQLLPYVEQSHVIIASSAYKDIKRQLLECGFPDERIALFNFAFMDLHETDYGYICRNIEQFAWTYNRLADEKSKSIYVNLLNYKISKDEKYLNALQIDPESEQYFDRQLIRMTNRESLVDVGAYTGDTLQTFLRMTERHFSAYYGIEADPATYTLLEKACYAMVDLKERIHLFQIAAWDKKTRLAAAEEDGSYGSYSFKESGGQEGLGADALDHILGEAPITTIKMDIEGAERQALRGLTGIIQKQLPKLAICVYHKRDDYFAIPQQIESIAPGRYNYYFRQYRYTPTETVCYAIPKTGLGELS